MEALPHMNAEEFVNLLLGNKGVTTRNISRTTEQGILKIKYQTRNSDGARIGLVVGTAAGLEFGPGAIVTGFIGASVGSLFDKWTTHTKYFDVSTGTFLGTSGNEAANKCNKNGQRNFRQKNFNEAKDWFNKAYHTCANDYREEDQFKENRNVANIAAKAQCLLNERKFVSAVSEFQRAYNLSHDVNICRVMNNCIAEAKQKQNEAASNSNQRGVELFQSWNFTEAETYFQRAFHSCSSDFHSKSMFSNNRYVAEVVSNAQTLLSRNDYNAAISKCQELCPLIGDRMRDAIARFMCHIKNKQNETASHFNQQGLLSFSEETFAEALQNFQEAYNSCTSDCVFRNKYMNNMIVVDIILEGKALFSRNEYAAAIEKFQEAHRKADGLNSNVINGHINRVKDKQNELAANFYCQGWKSFKEDGLSGACQYFEKAYSSCADDCATKSKYLNARTIANITSEAQTMSNRNDFDAAITKFKEACEFSHDTEMKHCISVYIDKTNVAKAEAVWKQGKLEWENAWAAENDNNVKEANSKFQKANCYFSKALNIKLNTKYQIWQKASCLKVEGNKLFNQGIKLFEESHLQESLSKLKEAQDQFQQGFHISGDYNFSECVNYVQRPIQCIEDMYKEIEEAKEINTAMRAVVVDIPVTTSHAELDEESLLEDQIEMKRHNDSYLSRLVSVGNGELFR